MSIIDAIFLLVIAIAVGVAIWAHSEKGKAEIASVHSRLDGFIAGFHLGASQPSEQVQAGESRSDPVTLPNTAQQVSGVTDAFLRSGSGYGRQDPPVVNQGPSVADDGVVRYNHHTYAHGVTQTLTTEPLQGKTRVSFTYTSQESGKQGPSWVWLSENGAPEQGPMQAGVEASFDLQATSGQVMLSYRSDTNGQTIAQLFRV